MIASEVEPGRRSLLERRSVFFVALASLLGISLAAEFRSYARPDTGFLLDAAARVLDGARLYVDVVEINPPLIIALNMVAVLSARLLHISDILAYRLGFTAALVGTLFLAGWLLRLLFPREIVVRRAFVLILAFVLFPLAGQDFGEREHLVLALLVPYLLLATARGLGRDIGRMPGLIIGLLAGLALALKPHFLLLWLAVECYLRASRRMDPKRVLPETVAIAALLATYGIALLALTPQYMNLVYLLAGPYSRFLHDPFFHVLVTGPGAILVIFALLAFAALRPHARHTELWQSIALGAAACLMVGAAQQKGLRYHLYPSFALGTVLLGLIAWDTVRPVRDRLRLTYRWLAVAVLAATVIVVCAQNLAVATGTGGDGDRDQFEDLVRVVRARAAGETVYVMSYHLRSAYPLINYSGARSASRFPHLWILAAEYTDQLRSGGPLEYHAVREMSPSERYLNRAVLDDLREHRPRLLVIFRHGRDLPVNGLRRLNYVAYFSRHPDIARILLDYQLIAELRDYLVYERLPSGGARSGAPPMVTPGTHDVIAVQESGVRLRFTDPSFLIAVLAFLIGLITIAILEREGEREQSASRVPVPRGE
ncbi:MAG: hypothetical protein ACREM9_07550 [Gemmatimonadales bacterium]